MNEWTSDFMALETLIDTDKDIDTHKHKDNGDRY